MSDQHLTVERELLDHSFYRRWVKGQLSIDELRDYVCQYAHIVARLPFWLRQTGTYLPAHTPRLQRHAIEEDDHVSLWTEFAAALGVSSAELASTRPNAATAELLKLGDQLSAQPIGVAVAWALEVQTPAVSAAKLDGLRTHYGIDSGSGGAYFDVHSYRDVIHAAELDEVIGGLSTDEIQRAQLVSDQVTLGLWNVLGSVEHAA